ncbi:MAG TPA: molecular chaperone DnaK [Candidatus Thermoplasmatota archaeon]
MAKVIGIDLGTTNSCMAYMVGGRPEVIPNAEGGRTTPSVVAYTKGGEVLVGQAAKRQAIVNPERTIASIKRKMGTDHTVKVDGKSYTPQDISASILQKMRRDAEAYLGEEVKQAVITVPAYFNDNQRQATKDAGRIAGLEVLRIINEPTASSLAYGLDKERGEKILVFDLGGGTFDVSVLEVGEGVFEVLSTSGDSHLGGDDWDELIVKWLAAEFRKQSGLDVGKDRQAMQRLKEAAEKAKIELSSVTTTNVNLPYLSVTPEGPAHLDVHLSRAKLEELTHDLFQRLRGPTEQALKDAKLGTAEIDRAILVGGATRMPRVQSWVQEYFGKEPYKNINPDECVAVGAAIQGGVIKGDVKDIVLLDVTPLSLGVETEGNLFERIIERNTTIPTRRSKTFSTASDNQTAAEIHVLQGERPMAADNISLGQFHLVGIPPMPRGMPQIEVTFDIDANGILNVSAKDLGTGKEQKIVITASTNLSEAEIQKKVKDAEGHAEDDRKRRAAAEARNAAESLIYQAEKDFNEYGEKLDAKLKGDCTRAIDALRQALQGTDDGAVQAALEAAKGAYSAMLQDMYTKGVAARGAPAGAGEGPPAGGTDEEKQPREKGKASPSDAGTVDAEYTVVDDDK